MGDSGAIVKGTTLLGRRCRRPSPLHYTVLFLLGKAEQETLEQEDRLKADLPAPSDEIQLTFSTLVSGVIVGRKEQLGYYAKGENLAELPL